MVRRLLLISVMASLMFGIGFTSPASADNKDKEKFKAETLCNCDWNVTLHWTKDGKNIPKAARFECGSSKLNRLDKVKLVIEKPEEANDIDITYTLDTPNHLSAKCKLDKKFRHLEFFHADCSVDKCFIKTDVKRLKSFDSRDSLEEDEDED